MDKTNLTKGNLWRKRIQDFYKSGLSRKQWCQEHQVRFLVDKSLV